MKFKIIENFLKITNQNYSKTILKFKLVFTFIVFIYILQSCIVVKENDTIKNVKYNEGISYQLTPKPTIEMSELLIRSDLGDMISLLPKDWILLKIDNNTNPDIFAIAVNKDYTLTAVFSIIRNTMNLQEAEKDGIMGVIKYSINKKKIKTSGNLDLFGNIDYINVGPYNYAKFNTTVTGGVINSQTALFKSSLNNYYEFAIIPIDIYGSKRPNQKETEEIFKSILTTIKY